MPRPCLPLSPDVPDDNNHIIRITASITNSSGDGFYRFENTSFAVLDPPTRDFYESYNAIIWTISLFTSAQGPIRTIEAVTVENPFVNTVSRHTVFTLAMSVCVHT